MKKNDFESSYLNKYTLRQLCVEEESQESTGRYAHRAHRKQIRKPKKFEKAN